MRLCFLSNSSHRPVVFKAKAWFPYDRYDRLKMSSDCGDLYERRVTVYMKNRLKIAPVLLSNEQRENLYHNDFRFAHRLIKYNLV